MSRFNAVSLLLMSGLIGLAPVLPRAAAEPAPAAPADAPPAIRPVDAAAAAKVSFAREIKPILTNRCLECHGSNKPKGEFVAKTVASLLKGGKKAGPSVIPGKPDESPVVQHVRGLRKPRMPKEGPPLSEDEVHLLREWIAAGAKDDSGAAAGSAAAGAAHASRPPSARTSAWEAGRSGSPAEQFAARRAQRLSLLPPPPAVPKVDAPANNPIDNFIVAKWASAVPAAQPALCDDAAFVRRAYLDVIGVVPTAEEAQAFVADAAPDKRAKLVDALLARNADYAAHWVPFWEDALCSNGNHQGGVGTRGNYRKWVYESFLADKPYDLMVAELIDPTLPNHPERFVLNNEHMKTLKTAADAAQVFLGTSIKCASCHSHFLNKEWPQARAAAYAGYFSPKDLELIRCEKKTGEFIETKFPFDLPGAPAAAPADLDGRLHLAAQLITDPTNPRFAKAIVNRLWRRYFGLGLFEPADDFRLDQPPSHPELLDWLADDFLRHDCDLKRTIRLLLTSRTYQLRYDPALEDRFDVEKPKAPRYYRSPSLRRLTAEQLLDSIRVVGAQKLEGGARTYLSDDSTPLTRSLGRPATRNETSTSRPDDVAVVQSLELMNGQEYHDRIYAGALVGELAREEDPAKAVTRAYWTALSRAPTEQEREAGAAFMKAGVARSPAAMPPGGAGDLLWALLTSPEFQYAR